MKRDCVVGIDLGTTNSAVALAQGGHIEMIPIDGDPLLPSVVGFDPEDRLLLGHPARNQYIVHPERTVRSVKRRMGEDVLLELGPTSMTPVEVSAALLRRLKGAAQRHLQRPVHRAVITVPAWFNDAQRTATREAGEVAGFEVERILNEPTAAALCYLGADDHAERVFLVYDLGGGTFDVSVVRARGRVTEVLASHGDTHLGGDDFDQELYRHLRQRFIDAHGHDPETSPLARARLLRAAEEAKIRLSSRAETSVIEEHLLRVEGVGLHLDVQLKRADYEALIDPWVQRTRDSVQIALRDAGVLAQALDDVLLVGGATRTPLVRRTLQHLLGREPRMDVDPDKAVAMGAAILAARVAGDTSQRILVDVTPFTFGTRTMGVLDGVYGDNAFAPILPRNTALPARKSRTFYTLFEGQQKIEVDIIHGEEPDARDNTLLGRFRIEDLDPHAPEQSPIRYDLALDLDGILHVDVTEVHTGNRKSVTIQDAFRKLSGDELIDARQRLLALFGDQDLDWEFAHITASHVDDPDAPPPPSPSPASASPAAPPELVFPQPAADLTLPERQTWVQACDAITQAARLLAANSLSSSDADEVRELADQLRAALDQGDMTTLQTQLPVLHDVLFYLQS